MHGKCSWQLHVLYGEHGYECVLILNQAFPDHQRYHSHPLYLSPFTGNPDSLDVIGIPGKGFSLFRDSASDTGSIWEQALIY